LKNVINDDGTELCPGTIDYTYRIISCLKRTLPDFDTYLFIVYNHNGTTLPISRNFWHPKKILFWEAGENQQQPFNKIKKDYLHIFSNHTKGGGKVHPIPLGYWDTKVSGEIVEMYERMYNVAFLGCLNRNRIALASLLSGKPIDWISMGLLKRKEKTLETLNQIVRYRYPRDFIKFTGDFGLGVPKDHYAYVMRNSKIVLAPRGWVSAECFRMYEGMMFGSVVITEKLPERPYYKGIPVIQVDKWKEGLYIARKLLKDMVAMEKMGKENRLFFENHFTPQSVALDIARVMKGKKIF
jgi:hypothetical protein